MTRITITHDDYDYRVPARDGREAGAYYTDDREDAIGTARHMWGADVAISWRKVGAVGHPGGDDDEGRCSNPDGHEFECTGSAYGGDDDRFHGEGRSYCIHCGADGDG